MGHTQQSRAWFALGVAAAIAGCPLPDAQIEAGASSGAGQCTTEFNDCPAPDNPCQEAVCNAERQCETQNVASQAHARDQIPGDCKVVVCDGHGTTMTVGDPQDVPDDGNDCTHDDCSGDVPAHTPMPAGTKCSQDGGTACNATGSCVGSCADGVLDGSETAIDCGGTCAPCADGQVCAAPSDCTGGACFAGTCCTPQPLAVTCAGLACGTTAMDDCGQTVTCPLCALWSHGFVNAGDARAVAVDAAGGVVMAGWFSATIDFGGGSITSASGLDIAVAKFDTSGNPVWSKNYGDVAAMTGDQKASDVALDAAGKVFVTGQSTVAGSQKGLLLGLDTDGSQLWRTDLTTAPSSIAGVVADADGHPVVTGSYMGSDFMPTTGNANVFVARGDPNTGALVGKGAGSVNQGARISTGVATDAAGNAFVVGYFSGNVDFGGPVLSSLGSNDIFVAKLDTSLDHVWSKRFGDTNDQGAQSVAVDAGGNVIVSGYANNGNAGNLDLGCGPMAIPQTTSAMFLVKLDPGGACLWSRLFLGIPSQSPNVVRVSAKGDIVLTGYFQSPISLGGPTLQSMGGYDIFVARLDAGGNHLWSRRFGNNTNNQYANGVGVDGAGFVLVTGSTFGQFDFGNGLIPSTATNALFLAKLAP